MTSHSLRKFHRDITHRVETAEDGMIALSGTIRDVYHDILLKVSVNPDNMSIAQASADFRRCPTTNCPAASSRMKMLIGLTIGRGMSRQLSEIFGGPEGCGNLRTMLAGLLPLAVNAQAAAGAASEDEMMDRMHETMRGCCAGYPVADVEIA